GDQLRDLDVLRIAAAAGHIRLEIRILALAVLDVRVDYEDQLAPACSEALAAAALAGLDDNGVALRRAWYGEWSSRAKKTALVIEAMDFLRSGKQARRFVPDNGLVLPRIPMAEHDLHEFVGPVVAKVVLDDLLAAHILGFSVIEGCNDIPCRAPLGHQIERGEKARHVEWLVVTRRIGRAEAEPLGCHPH